MATTIPTTSPLSQSIPSNAPVLTTVTFHVNGKQKKYDVIVMCGSTPLECQQQADKIRTLVQGLFEEYDLKNRSHREPFTTDPERMDQEGLHFTNTNGHFTPNFEIQKNTVLSRVVSKDLSLESQEAVKANHAWNSLNNLLNNEYNAQHGISSSKAPDSSKCRPTPLSLNRSLKGGLGDLSPLSPNRPLTPPNVQSRGSRITPHTTSSSSLSSSASSSSSSSSSFSSSSFSSSSSSFSSSFSSSSFSLPASSSTSSSTSTPFLIINSNTTSSSLSHPGSPLISPSLLTTSSSSSSSSSSTLSSLSPESTPTSFPFWTTSNSSYSSVSSSSTPPFTLLPPPLPFPSISSSISPSSISPSGIHLALRPSASTLSSTAKACEEAGVNFSDREWFKNKNLKPRVKRRILLNISHFKGLRGEPEYLLQQSRQGYSSENAKQIAEKIAVKQSLSAFVYQEVEAIYEKSVALGPMESELHGEITTFMKSLSRGNRLSSKDAETLTASLKLYGFAQDQIPTLAQTDCFLQALLYWIDNN